MNHHISNSDGIQEYLLILSSGLTEYESWLCSLLTHMLSALIFNVVLTGVIKLPPHMQLNSSTSYGPVWLCTSVLSRIGIALVASAISQRYCRKITRCYGTEVLSTSVWDRGRKPQERRLFGSQFHQWEASIISKGRQFVSFEAWAGGSMALRSFCRARSLKITRSLLLLPAAGSVVDVATPPKELLVTQVSQSCDGGLARSCSWEALTS